MDWQNLGADAIKALIPILGMVIVFGLRLVLPKLPRFSLPVIAMALGFGLDWLLAYISGGTFTPVIGALLGAASTWLREIINTVQEHGTT